MCATVRLMPRPAGTPPDMLRFIGGTIGEHEVGWTGPWPPPEYLRVAHGQASGQITVAADDVNTDAVVAASGGSIIVTRFRRRSFSIIPDTDPFPGVFRGAEYVPVTND